MSSQLLGPPARRPPAWELPRRDIPPPAESARIVEYVTLRLTGLVLSVLVLGHFAVTHFVTDVAHDNATFVARRLSSAVWIAWDGTMLAAALAHGAIGVRLALADYTAQQRTRRVLGWAVVGVALLLFVLGLIAIGRAAGI